MTPERIALLAHLRRARDRIDREYAEPLDVPTMAARAFMSPAHFSRQFALAFGETPYAYLRTRRVERAMQLLRAGTSVTDACLAVGCTSLGSFSSRFSELTGESPSRYAAREHRAVAAMPSRLAHTVTRPRRDRQRRDRPATSSAVEQDRRSGATPSGRSVAS
jgi:AraC-like DNA-binding protein